MNCWIHSLWTSCWICWISFSMFDDEIRQDKSRGRFGQSVFCIFKTMCTRHLYEKPHCPLRSFFPFHSLVHPWRERLRYLEHIALCVEEGFAHLSHLSLSCLRELSKAWVNFACICMGQGARAGSYTPPPSRKSLAWIYTCEISRRMNRRERRRVFKPDESNTKQAHLLPRCIFKCLSVFCHSVLLVF